MSVSSTHPNLMGSLGDLDEWAMSVRQLEAKGALPGGVRAAGPAPSLEGLAVRGFPVGLLPPTTTLRRKASSQVLTLYDSSTLDSAVAAYSSMVPVVIAVPSPTSSSLTVKIEEYRIARQHHASSTVQSALAEREQQSLTFLEMVVGGSSVQYDSADGSTTTTTTYPDCLFVAVDMMTLHQLLLLPDHAIVSAPNPLLGTLPPGADAAASTQYYSNPDRTLTAVADAIWELNGADLLSILLPIPYIPNNDVDSVGDTSPSLPHSPLSFSGWTTLRLSHRGGDGAPPSGSTDGGSIGDGVPVPPSPFYNALVGSSDEANTFGATPTIDRVHYSYLCVLSYLGWRLHSEETGELDRHRGWKQRYSTLLHPPTTTTSSVLPLDTVLTALLTFLLGMRLVTFATRLILFIVDEAKAGRLVHLVVSEGAVVRTTLLPILSTSLYLDGPVMGPEEVARVEAVIKKMVDNESDSE